MLPVSWAGALYIHFRWLLPRNGILPGTKFTLRPSLALSYTGSVTAQHSSSGHKPNFAALSRGPHLCSTGRPSRWALAHILVFKSVFFGITSFSLCEKFHQVDTKNYINYSKSTKTTYCFIDVSASHRKPSSGLTSQIMFAMRIM